MITEEQGGEIAPETGKPESVATPEAIPQVEKVVLQEVAQEKSHERYQEILSKVTPGKQASGDDDAVVALDAKHIGALTDEESKVQKLMDLASAKGVVHAVKVARSLRDYYALDRLHDELADKLYQGLVEKGLIEKE